MGAPFSPVRGLSHLTLIVRDLERARRLFVGVLGGEEVYASGGRTFSRSRECFFRLGGLWIAAMEGEPRPPGSYDHIAFRVREADLEPIRARLTEAGFPVEPDRPRVPGEGRSVYFRDDDGHLFELHSGTLGRRLRAYSGR